MRCNPLMMNDILEIGNMCYDVTKPHYYEAMPELKPEIIESLPSSYTVCKEKNVNDYFEQILNKNYRLCIFNGFSSDWFFLTNCGFCESIGFSDYKYCHNCCRDMCYKCYDERYKDNEYVSDDQNDKMITTSCRNKSSKCEKSTLVDRSLYKIPYTFTCVKCNNNIACSESRYTDKNINVCLGCFETNDGKLFCEDNNLKLQTIANSLKMREFGSLLDWKPLIIDCEENKLLVNLNPESNYYNKFCLSAMDDHGRCGYFIIWSNETLDQLVDELLEFYRIDQEKEEKISNSKKDCNSNNNSDSNSENESESVDDDCDEPIKKMMLKRNMWIHYG